MTTFNKIINKVVNLDNNIFLYNYDKNDKIGGLNKILFYALSTNKNNNFYKNKFYFLKENINNFYFSQKPTECNEFINLFYKIQKIYHILNRFCFLYKYKKSKIIVETDLQLNSIKINDKNVICIYHIDSKYLFKIDELLKLIYTSLTNCFSFFSEPINIKNPYNNIPFGKSILYYIYFKLILDTKLNFIKHDYIDIFFKFTHCNFNMTKFVNSYEYLLREYAIKNYLNNLTKRTMKQEIINMLKNYNTFINTQNKKIIISNEFPDDELIKIMKPYLYLDLVSNFSLIKNNQIDAKRKLYKKLYEFQEFNPTFGKKIIKLKNIIDTNGKFKRVKSHFEFDTRHKKFYTYEIENFMNNHLEYKYEDYSHTEYIDLRIPMIFNTNTPYLNNQSQYGIYSFHEYDVIQDNDEIDEDSEDNNHESRENNNDEEDTDSVS